jgi:hypothetical protein
LIWNTFNVLVIAASYRVARSPASLAAQAGKENTLIIKITELALLCSFEIKKNISFEKFIEWLTYRFLLPLMFGFCRISHLFSFCNVQMKKVR